MEGVAHRQMRVIASCPYPARYRTRTLNPVGQTSVCHGRLKSTPQHTKTMCSWKAKRGNPWISGLPRRCAPRN